MPVRDEDSATWFVIVGGVALPAVVLVILFGFTLSTMHAFASPPTPPEFTIQITGHQFWWEVHYPDQAIVTANEIHVPAGKTVQLELTSADVIHSFWVPQLRGKIDLIPGQVNSVWFRAEQAGIYRGQCAEFCGVQHAHMAILVIADPPDQFSQWVAQQTQPATTSDDPQIQAGARAFAQYGCIGCHTVEFGNLPKGGTDSPNLTHIGSRQTLAAGTVNNTPGSLAGWIADPQNIKPGNLMPNLHVDSVSLIALTTFLQSLK